LGTGYSTSKSFRTSEDERLWNFEVEWPVPQNHETTGGGRIAFACRMVHNAYMNRDATITLRIPSSLKRRLEARARNLRRSLSSQVVHDLETLLMGMAQECASGKFLGLYQGSRIPTDAEIAEVRSVMWGSLVGRE
jgi:hypothetical protein